MNVPPSSNPIWRDLVTGKAPCNCEFMATRVLLTRISALASYDASKIPIGVEELRSLFLKNISVPKVQSDLQRIFGPKYQMSPVFYTVEEIAKRLALGKNLLVAGFEETLNRIPKGSWIGGTTPLLGGLRLDPKARDHVFAVEIPGFHTGVDIKLYETPEALSGLYTEAPENGFSIVIIPAGGSMHLSFALNGPHYPNFATRPVAGWVSGVPLVSLDVLKPLVYDGQTGQKYRDCAVVMAIKLPANKIAEIGVVNIFEQGHAGTLQVEKDGFEHQFVLVNGNREPFAEYVRKHWVDTRLPLVADYNGLMVNTSFQKILSDGLTVRFYAPLFKGIRYEIAKPIDNFKNVFLERLPNLQAGTDSFSFNCYLNYLLMLDLENERPDALLGPTTFGEIAYQLLNQTLAYVTIKDLT